ncbi:sugar phosphate isomerase/epimerase family protein [Paenibacillus sp. NPDC056579]|uniref:sugar phosphate isomerase/epimerase family protein n=1 Tax=unclassified Paenibacillus TaxID=185978 RepID=UPI001EF97F73|nr:sugar phosphate isomerase/epimerase family protein [Paenibacillus sp. H1-7]ULL14542.1 sugar phosphate isomerase/epimerase [Paenibacillus sp. H1-7]
MTAFGWCMGIEQASEIKEHGFDYIECPLAPLLQLEPDAFKKALPLYWNSPIPVRAWNILFPGGLPLVGPAADEQRIRDYLARAVDTMASVGSTIVVFGSGKARTVPEGWEKSRAEEQLLNLLGWAADECKGTGLTLVIEPLNRKESNIINSVAEGVALARLVNRDPIRVLADFYHMDEEQEPLDTIGEHKDWLAHIHVADTGRRSPGTGSYPYEAFVKQLKQAGYSGGVSVECSVAERTLELPASLSFLRRQWGLEKEAEAG